MLAALGIRTCFKTVQRVSERVGAKVAVAQHGPFARARAPSEAPPNPPELLVLQGDGMRVRELTEASDTAGEGAENGATEAAEEFTREDLSIGWRECKVGTVASCLHGGTMPGGEYEEPETLVQTCVATMEDIKLFGEKLRAEAERRGLLQAEQVVAVSDAGHGLPGMWETQFADVDLFWIADYEHVKTRLEDCAGQVAERGAAYGRLSGRWKGLLYDGEVNKLLRELTARASEHAPRPERPSELPEQSPGRILWTHVFYIEQYRDHMDYPTYRANGWPIASGHVEAKCKQIGLRMKAANKRWKPVVGSEAMVNLIADRVSEDGRWERRWPAHVYPAEKPQPS